MGVLKNGLQILSVSILSAFLFTAYASEQSLLDMVTTVDALVKKSSGSKISTVRILGLGSTKQYEFELDDLKVIANDHFLIIRQIEKTDGGKIKSTAYWFDEKKDGELDRLIDVPGYVAEIDEQFVQMDFLQDLNSLKTQASLSEMEREMDDRPSLHRIIHIFEGKGVKGTMLSFETAASKEIPEAQRVKTNGSWNKLLGLVLYKLGNLD